MTLFIISTVGAAGAFEPASVVVIIKEQSFLGYTFGTSDCNRLEILGNQVPSPRRDYTMKVLAKKYSQRTPDEMYGYCEQKGYVFGNANTYREWTPE